MGRGELSVWETLSFALCGEAARTHGGGWGAGNPGPEPGMEFKHNPQSGRSPTLAGKWQPHKRPAAGERTNKGGPATRWTRFSYDKERSPDTRYHVGEPKEHDAERKKRSQLRKPQTTIPFTENIQNG